MSRNRSERRAAGKALRAKVPRASHGDWAPVSSRVDPVTQIIESSKGRIPALVPIRYGRMLPSAFTLYRGAANIMAADLATTPVTGLTVQSCGDCHLMNFGLFATPELNLFFDINDFDETLPGPWEWDVKRLATSMVLASRSNGFHRGDQHDAALSVVRSYRKRMAAFAEMSPIETWDSRIDLPDVFRRVTEKAALTRFKKRLARTKADASAHDAYPDVEEGAGKGWSIKDNRPLIYHDPMLMQIESDPDIEAALERYRATLISDRRALLRHYQRMDSALKVVGVGSVGTLCAVFLMMTDDEEPLFLQFKEARPSVLAPFVTGAATANEGQRVVEGQRLMQAASDIFLGWTNDGKGRDYYVRQLRAAKMKPVVDAWDPETMNDYGGLCGWTLARAHARSGDAATIAGYLGSNDAFDQAVARFAVAYADQTEQDFDAFKAAIASGRIVAQAEA